MIRCRCSSAAFVPIYMLPNKKCQSFAAGIFTIIRLEYEWLNCLYRKTFAAATGAFGIRIIKIKTFAIEAIRKLQRRIAEV
jgi:hypothetical protein